MTIRPTNESTIGELISELIRIYGLQEGMQLERIRSVWGRSLSPSIIQRTRSLSFKKGVLTVHMNSAVVRNELQLIREEIRLELNKELKEELIRELIIF